ncbi:hypothetical protein [Pseudoalteromonas sp. NC201]|uniref:hypothetical protein n=1 Tax=Pseudoalteromonas sp. NC201 TaxID=1514074 RepID=UPI000CA0C06F|nr:hypothetical protein [Pseudoalteromonas sp. NC201]AUJ69935.1 hypothetical protein PNC201_08205 [Pseudoalteromonas sp. NC201]
MNIAIFVVSFVVYVCLCLGIVKFHKHLADKLKLTSRHSLLNVFSQYIWFLMFIVTYIPFSIFFPAWLNGKLGIVQESPNVTAIFIFLGCFTLAVTMWLGYKETNQANW